MPVTTKIAALLPAVTTADVEAMSPAERQRLAQWLRHVANMAEPKGPQPRSGVLYHLKSGARAE